MKIILQNTVINLIL